MFAIIDVYSRKIVGWSISNTIIAVETILDAANRQIK